MKAVTPGHCWLDHDSGDLAYVMDWINCRLLTNQSAKYFFNKSNPLDGDRIALAAKTFEEAGWKTKVVNEDGRSYLVVYL